MLKQTASAGMDKHKVHKDSTNLAVQLLRNHEVTAGLNLTILSTLSLQQILH